MKRYIRSTQTYNLDNYSIEYVGKTIKVPITLIGDDTARSHIFLPISQINLKSHQNTTEFTVPDWIAKEHELGTKYKIVD